MGGLPDAVRTHYAHSGDKESALLAQLLLIKRKSGEIIHPISRASELCQENLSK